MTQINGMSYTRIILFLCTVERQVSEIILTNKEGRCLIKKNDRYNVLIKNETCVWCMQKFFSLIEFF